MEKKMKVFTQLVTGALACMIVVMYLCFSSCKKIVIPAFYKVTFNTQGGSAISPIGVKPCSSITLPDTPTKAGATFDGWFFDKECVDPFPEITTISADLTLYAKWNEQFYSVTFDLNGGDGPTISPITGLKYGNNIIFPPEPTRTNYLFNGWYADKEASGASFSEITSITDNVTLYANWVSFKPPAFRLLSESLRNGEQIPYQYARGYGNVSPQLSWINVPKKTRSFLIIMDTYYINDPQESLWTVYSIPIYKRSLAENDPWLPNPGFFRWRGRYRGPTTANVFRLTIYALDVEPDYFNQANYPEYAREAKERLGNHILASDYFMLYYMPPPSPHLSK